MFRPLPDLPPGVLGFEAVGEIQAEDYHDVLRPALDDAAAAGGIRLVVVIGSEFSGYSAGASWEDAKLAVHHVSAWERTALVSDVEWVRHMAGAFGWMVPGRMRAFPLGERDSAIRWVADTEEGATSVEDGIDQVTSPPVTPVVVDADPDPTDAGSGVAPLEGSGADAGDTSEHEPVVAAHALPQQQTLTPRAPLNPGADFRAVPMPVAPAVPAQWAPDPSGRHQHRWWDGERWTEHVADNGISAVDPLR